jgi:hypothetical protein
LRSGDNDEISLSVRKQKEIPQNIKWSKPARAAHGAVVTGLAAGIYRALLFVFEKLNQLRDGGFLDSKSFLAGMLNHLRAADCGLRTVSLS